MRHTPVHYWKRIEIFARRYLRNSHIGSKLMKNTKSKIKHIQINVNTTAQNGYHLIMYSFRFRWLLASKHALVFLAFKYPRRKNGRNSVVQLYKKLDNLLALMLHNENVFAKTTTKAGVSTPYSSLKLA